MMLEAFLWTDRCHLLLCIDMTPHAPDGIDCQICTLQGEVLHVGCLKTARCWWQGVAADMPNFLLEEAAFRLWRFTTHSKIGGLELMVCTTFELDVSGLSLEMSFG